MMFNLILIFLVLNLAVIIRELTGSHLIRARCASRLHLQCGRQSPQCVLNTSVSPVVRFIYPVLATFVSFSLEKLLPLLLFMFSLLSTLFWCSMKQVWWFSLVSELKSVLHLPFGFHSTSSYFLEVDPIWSSRIPWVGLVCCWCFCDLAFCR